MSVKDIKRTISLVVLLCFILVTQLVVCTSCSCSCEEDPYMEQLRAQQEQMYGEHLRLQSLLDQQKVEIEKKEASLKALQDKKITVESDGNTVTAEKENLVSQLGTVNAEKVTTESLTLTTAEEIEKTKARIAEIQIAFASANAKLTKLANPCD
jgi:hypothetical protein